MEITSRELAVTLLTIQRLSQTCDALNGMFGNLLVTLSKSGVSMDLLQALEEDWKERWKGVVGNEEGSVRLTDTGVSKEITLEDEFDELLSRALHEARSEHE